MPLLPRHPLATNASYKVPEPNRDLRSQGSGTCGPVTEERLGFQIPGPAPPSSPHLSLPGAALDPNRLA